MPYLDNAGIKIHYELFGEGKPIVLLHGFASNLRQNWIDTGWADALTPIRSVIAIDLRGHGESDKPSGPDAYANDAMSGDVVAVMDHLAVEKADVFGYSMGGGIALRLLGAYPERFGRAVIGGVGERNDERLQALDGVRGTPETAFDLTAVDHPVLIVNGENDHAVGDLHTVASRLANASVLTIPGCEHMTVVADQRFKDAVLEFLE